LETKFVSILVCLLASACGSSGSSSDDSGLITISGSFAAPGDVTRVQMNSISPCQSGDVSPLDAEFHFSLSVQKGCEYLFQTVKTQDFGPTVRICSNFPTGNQISIPTDAPDSWDLGTIVSCESLFWPSNAPTWQDCTPEQLPAGCGGEAASNSADDQAPVLDPIQGIAQYRYDHVFVGKFAGIEPPGGDGATVRWCAL